jgi:hypothetical protein
MTMCSADEHGQQRSGFNFPRVVAERFAFLAAFGFSPSQSGPTFVSYRRDDLELHVYHGRQSFEVGLHVGCGADQFSLSELIRASDPAAAEDYRNPVATTPASVESAVDQLAQLVQRYGERALDDDPLFLCSRYIHGRRQKLHSVKGDILRLPNSTNELRHG